MLDVERSQRLLAVCLGSATKVYSYSTDLKVSFYAYSDFSDSSSVC